MNPPAPHTIKTIAEYHLFMGLPKPEHPLISVLRFEDIKRQPSDRSCSIIHEFYSVALKKDVTAKIKYGQQNFDFDGGVMHFMSPKQVLTIQSATEEKFTHSGWLLLIHPDFMWNKSLSKKIKHYEYFSYKVTEALHLSDKEEMLLTEIIGKIAQEYHANIDKFSQDVILAQIELLLTYSDRFYQRQFITRRISNSHVLDRLNTFLEESFSDEYLAEKGIPTVTLIAEHLNVSSNYLSRLLQQLTGHSTQQFIHDKLISIAKEKLSTTDMPVNEIAYSLGFEHPQSFNRLFKSKTSQSPLAFRHSFN